MSTVSDRRRAPSPTPRPMGWARMLGRSLGIVGVLVLVLAVRVVSAARGELAEADGLRARGETAAALTHYRRAARWYAPGNPYCSEALSRLAEIGAAAEEAGDPELALAAYRSMRGAILGARSFYVPHGDRLELADARIATLLASLPPPAIDAGRSPEERRAEHLALLRDVPRPALGWSLLALLGLATWIASSFGFVQLAIDEEDRLIAGAARIWGTAWLAGFGSFVLGLALA